MNSMKEYITIEHRYEEEYIINKSRFIGYACPVTTQEEAVEFINEIRKKHSDATHNVYAYQIRTPEYSRYSDDCEPQGTAGMPVLDVIKKSGLTDICIVVTRYFGGILLGAGGLVRAYSHSASIAAQGANIIRMSPCSVLKVVCDYGFYGRLSTLVPEFGGIIENTDFGENVTMEFRLQSKDEEAFRKELTEVSFGRVTAEKTGEKFDSI